jgi:hypothetical protein
VPPRTVDFDFSVLPEPKRAWLGCTAPVERGAPAPSPPGEVERTALEELPASILELPSRALMELGAELADDEPMVEPVLRKVERPERLLAVPVVLVLLVPAPSAEPLPTCVRPARGSRRWGWRTPPKRGVTGRSTLVLPSPLPLPLPSPVPREEPELVELPKRPPEGSVPTPDEEEPVAPLPWPKLPPRDGAEEPRPALPRPTCDPLLPPPFPLRGETDEPELPTFTRLGEGAGEIEPPPDEREPLPPERTDPLERPEPEGRLGDGVKPEPEGRLGAGV